LRPFYETGSDGLIDTDQVSMDQGNNDRHACRFRVDYAFVQSVAGDNS
jgi:hypothetical protein